MLTGSFSDCEVALDRTLRIVTGEVADSEHEGALVETVTMTSTRTGAQPQAYRMSVLAPGTPFSLHHPLHWLFAHTLRVFLTLPKAAGYDLLFCERADSWMPQLARFAICV